MLRNKFDESGGSLCNYIDNWLFSNIFETILRYDLTSSDYLQLHLLALSSNTLLIRLEDIVTDFQ